MELKTTLQFILFMLSVHSGHHYYSILLLYTMLVVVLLLLPLELGRKSVLFSKV